MKPVMKTLYHSYERVPKQLSKPIINWGIPFLFGLVITLIWDVGTLLSILLIIFILSFVVNEIVSGKARRISRIVRIIKYFMLICATGIASADLQTQ